MSNDEKEAEILWPSGPPFQDGTQLNHVRDLDEMTLRVDGKEFNVGEIARALIRISTIERVEIKK